MGRRRTHKHRGLPQNLYLNKGIYFYRHPKTKVFHSLGDVKSQAVADAKKLNAVLVKVDVNARIHKVLSAEAGTMAALCQRYLDELVSAKKQADRTHTDRVYRVKRIIRDIGTWPLEIITVRQVSDYLDTLKENPYQRIRAELKDIFQFAIAKGLMPPAMNPAAETLDKKPSKRDRYPLKLEDYEAIHALAEPWLQVAMEMIFITLQRPVDLVQTKYEDIREDVLYVQQQKVERHENWQSNLAIAVKGRLLQTIKKSRADEVVSPYIVHKKPLRKIRDRKNCDHWTQLQSNYIGREFAKIRDSLPQFKDMPPANKPSFYEIKALGGFVYIDKYGWTKEQVQALMGHTKTKTTEIYVDRHIEWSCVAVE